MLAFHNGRLNHRDSDVLILFHSMLASLWKHFCTTWCNSSLDLGGVSCSLLEIQPDLSFHENNSSRLLRSSSTFDIWVYLSFDFVENSVLSYFHFVDVREHLVFCERNVGSVTNSHNGNKQRRLVTGKR